MELVFTNTTAADITIPLPSGGRVRANSSATFSGVVSRVLELAMPVIDPFLDSGDLTLDSMRPESDDSDLGARIWKETLTVAVVDLTDAALTQLFESTFTFPERARARGFHSNLGVAFSDGAAGTGAIDTGFSAAKPDVFDSALNVAGGATLGEAFGVQNSDPESIGGEKLRTLFTSSVNVNLMVSVPTATITSVVYYSIH